MFGIVLASSPASPTGHRALPTDLSHWTPAIHDRFIADTKQNIGYIVHENGDYTMFRIGSGKRQEVNYGGHTYNAATPETIWHVESTTYQTDKITFGKSGFFLRLYDNDAFTPYGIHATANIDDLLTWDDRYRSMGCILVSNEVLDVLAHTYVLNGNDLEVATIYGIEKATMVLY